MRDKVSIGCGKVDFGKDWWHIDAVRHLHVDMNDIYLSSFDDESFKLIYASHFLEYFNSSEAAELLARWWNKLEYGGILRLAVPDFRVMASLYESQVFDLKHFIGPLYGRIGVDGKNIYHKMIYDENTLTLVLYEAGFRTVRRWDWRTTEHSHIDDCSQAYLPAMLKENGTLISLNMEAVK